MVACGEDFSYFGFFVGRHRVHPVKSSGRDLSRLLETQKGSKF